MLLGRAFHKVAAATTNELSPVFTCVRTTSVERPLPSESGTEMMTPLPVPIHSRLQEVNRDVIRTNEKPSLPVPANQHQTNCCHLFK